MADEQVALSDVKPGDIVRVVPDRACQWMGSFKRAKANLIDRF